MRITDHPILENIKNRKKVTIIYDGKKIDASEGEPIAVALFASGIKVLRRTSKYNEPRGIFCNRGRCTDCIMRVNGKPNVRTCITMVKEGMVIESLKRFEKWKK